MESEIDSSSILIYDAIASCFASHHPIQQRNACNGMSSAVAVCRVHTAYTKKNHYHQLLSHRNLIFIASCHISWQCRHRIPPQREDRRRCMDEQTHRNTNKPINTWEIYIRTRNRSRTTTRWDGKWWRRRWEYQQQKCRASGERRTGILLNVVL